MIEEEVTGFPARVGKLPVAQKKKKKAGTHQL